ncbi:MAG TPA: diaminopimelate epimerase [Tepidisphaeraceae bacterium]|nr:diaminopimelate epimerase [Tepidisphaeraceae bacterium]
MKFTKMHGIGNDYVYVNGFAEKVADPGEVARKVSDRHFGIGSDGLILILPSERADLRMRMFNADGSEGEMCGNGVRCVAKYAYDHGLTKNNPMRVETGRGVLTLELKTDGAAKVEQVTVNMGAPILNLPDIPVVQGAAGRQALIKKRSEHEYELAMEYDGWPVVATFVSTGNPHVVVFVPDVQKLDLEKIGPPMEHYAAFPKRINAHWATVTSQKEVRMRTWERGSGITWACGTGACAVVVAGVLTGRLERKCLVHLPGGDLSIEWRDADNNIYMTGPATEVFSGDWNG